MAVTIDPRAEQRATPPDVAPGQPEAKREFPLPYLGRTVRIVGPVGNVDPEDMPHPKNQRGELGKALFNWMHSTISKDPLQRVAFSRHAADKKNCLSQVVNKLPKGKVNSERTPVPDPGKMTEHIKRVAYYMGADIVGVAASHPSFIYAGKIDDDDTLSAEAPAAVLARRYPFAIVLSVAWNEKNLRAHRHHIGDAAYDFTSMQTRLILNCLEGYIHELGYNTLRGSMNGQAAWLAAGLGELGRNGLIITEKFGPRIHASEVIMTDLPLVPGKPLDIGVEDFCKICRKCAVNCPTNSITFDGKVVHNGVEKYKIKWETCYKIRPYVVEHWGQCLTCIAACPYTKPDTWWHTLAVNWLKRTPIPLRPPVAHTLKWIDDKLWGEVPKRRVRWLWYDSGIKPGERACTVAGCTAAHEEGEKQTVTGNVGYYAPIKAETTRFVKRA